MFLVQKMQFGWHEVHHIVEQIEHVNSPEFFDRIDQLLGYPKTDPHGSPIPDKNGNIILSIYQSLSDCAPGSSVRLMALKQSDAVLLEMLMQKDITIGTTLKIIHK
jgi:DtxR family Mn-dependent transcriptional regulator